MNTKKELYSVIIITYNFICVSCFLFVYRYILQHGRQVIFVIILCIICITFVDYNFNYMLNCTINGYQTVCWLSLMLSLLLDMVTISVWLPFDIHNQFLVQPWRIFTIVNAACGNWHILSMNSLTIPSWHLSSIEEVCNQKCFQHISRSVNCCKFRIYY